MQLPDFPKLPTAEPPEWAGDELRDGLRAYEALVRGRSAVIDEARRLVEADDPGSQALSTLAKNRSMVAAASDKIAALEARALQHLVDLAPIVARDRSDATREAGLTLAAARDVLAAELRAALRCGDGLARRLAMEHGNNRLAAEEIALNRLRNSALDAAFSDARRRLRTGRIGVEIQGEMAGSENR